jgi:hypothetical protein
VQDAQFIRDALALGQPFRADGPLAKHVVGGRLRASESADKVEGVMRQISRLWRALIEFLATYIGG